MKSVVQFSLAVTIALFTVALKGLAQPKPLSLPDGSRNLKTIGDLVYFTTTDGSVYRTDGTDEGTLLLRSGGNANLIEFIGYKGMAFWFEGASLWRSNGLPSGTVRLISGLSSSAVLDSTRSYLFFGASSLANGRELYRTDGTVAGTMMIKDLNPGSADGLKGSWAVFGDELFFSGSDGVHGAELWKTNGTTLGTMLVKDVNPGSGDGVTGIINSSATTIFFSGTDVSHGTELWKSDGTSGGTVMVKDVEPGAPDSFTGEGQAVGNHFYFSNGDPSNPKLWVSDGTAARTFFLQAVDFRFMVETNGRVFFYNQWNTGNGMQTDVWKSDGTSASTIKLASLDIDTHFAEERYPTYNDKVFFRAQDSNGAQQYVWESDGTEAGTRIIFTDFLDGQIRFFQIVNGFLFYYTTSQGNNLDLHVIDVTGAGRSVHGRHFLDAQAAGGEILMAKVGEFVLFSDHDGPTIEGRIINPEDALQLFQTDGMNLISLRDMFGTSFQYTRDIIDFNGKALFSTGGSTKKWWIYQPGWEKAGMVQQEIWNDIPGIKVSDIPVNTPPSSVADLHIFETPTNVDDNYGSRVRGYVVAPESGNYTFWLASDDQSELWLSTDDDPSKKVKIAQVTGWTNPRQWDRYSSQKSLSKKLVAGEKYYIAALLKEASGGDHLAVGWQLPNGTLERPIPGERLISFERPTSLPKIAITSPREGQVYTAPANVLITARDEGSVSKVEFYNGTVKLGDASSRLTFEWNNVPEGNYTLIAKAIDSNGKIAVDELNFVVSGGGEPCAGAGMIRQEFWMNVPGTQVSAIPLDREPDLVHDLVDFVGPPSDFQADNYGSRIRGYICPPSSGEYTFWISGDDNVELWLSTDSNPANKRKIAYHTGWTNRNEWNKYPTQQSVAITLAARQKYYIEALMKEGSRADHISVGWRVPGAQLTTLRGTYLIPFERQTTEPACVGTGTISLETWTGIDGPRVSSIPLSTPPNFTGERTSFEAPTNVGSNFGTRARGYICAPMSGNYTFWFASDDQGELWLSTDEDPTNKKRIAYHTGWTSPQQWTKYVTQQSSPIALVAGQRYYIEALYKEDEGGDNMAVGWQLPDGTLERPIPGNRLSPFEHTASLAAASTTTDSQNFSEINVYPNPAHGRDPQLTIAGYERTERAVEIYVEIVNIAGEVVFAERIECGGDCSAYPMRLSTQLKPGVYVIRMKTNNTRHIKRLLVK